MRRPLLALAAVCAVAAAALLVGAASARNEVAFTVGLPAVQQAEVLPPGAEACRGPLEARASFTRLRVVTASFGRPGPALELAVRAPGGRALGRGVVPDGYDDGAQVEADVGGIAAGRRVELCAVNRGGDPVLLRGAPPATLASELDAPDADAGPAFVALRAEPRSVLDQVPDMAGRAAVFKPAGVGAWTYWLMAGLVALAVPALLAGALRAAYASERS